MKYQILLIGTTPPPFHGVSIMTQNLLESYLPHQFKICFLDIIDRRGLSNLGVLDFQNIFLACYHFLKFIKILLIYNPELVYIPISQTFWGYIRDLLFLIPSRIFNKKILIHLHGSAFNDFYRSMHWSLMKITEYIFNGKVWGIVLGETLKPCFKNLIEERNIFVVPNGIKTVINDNQTNIKSYDKIHILYLSNLRESKGFFFLLSVIPTIIKSYTNVHFTLAGEKTHELEINKANNFIYQNDLMKYVEMPGVVVGKEKELLLNSADIFVFPPIEKEGQPVVLLEAMAAGLPIISTNTGAINEMIINGKNGFLISAGDSEALMKNLLKLIRDKTLRERMGNINKLEFQKEYTLECWLNNMANVFNNILA